MEINTDDLAKQCVDEINKRIKNLKKLNIVVVGKSGVGKSTLINSVFRDDLAKTGVGRPVTDTMRCISKPDYPLTIYDTPGFEQGSEQQKKVKDDILGLIRSGVNSKDINQAIHCIWYCINAQGNRIEPSEVEWLKNFTTENAMTQVPVIVVLTQACPKKKANELKAEVEKENLNIVKVVPVLAQDMDFDEEYIATAYGLDTLIDVMQASLPTELRDTLQNVQTASLQAKHKAAQTAVAAAVTAAFGTGFAPIPFSDAAILIPTQVGMIAGITVIYGFDISKSMLTGFVSATIGTSGATVLGKTIVANLLKLIPGVGTAAGGAISGATAGLLTTALGEAYIQLMDMMYRGEMKESDLAGEKGKETIQALFQEELKKKR